jgi:glycosyltransferase involved in cell wall biosynthesis
MSFENRHIMIFDLYSHGHHATYVRQLCEFWIDQPFNGKLSVVLSETYAKHHKELLDFIQLNKKKSLSLYIVSGLTLHESEGNLRQLFVNDRIHGKVARQFVEKLRPTHVVFLYLDHVQISLITGLRFKHDVAVGGIIFKPTLHYPFIGFPASTLKEQLKYIRKKIILSFALKNRHIRFLFSLDPYSVPYLKKLSSQITCIALPDGYKQTPVISNPSTIRGKHGIEPNRRIALFFGVISERKGICKVFESLNKLSTSNQKKLCLLIVGQALKMQTEWIKNKIYELHRKSEVQVIWYSTFIPDEDIQDYFRCADIVLVTYQRHVGSSHILVRAAAEGIPVIGSNYGLLGKYILGHYLGSAIDTAKADVIAQAINEWLEKGILESFSIEHALNFARHNKTEQFASKIFNTCTK